MAGSILWCTPLRKYLPDGVGEGLGLHGFHQKSINPYCFSLLGVNEGTIAHAQDNGNVRTDTPQLTYQEFACHVRHDLVGDDEVKVLGATQKAANVSGPRV